MKNVHLILLLSLGAMNSKCALYDPKTNRSLIAYDEFKEHKYPEFYQDAALIESFSKTQWLLSDAQTEEKGVELAQRLTTEYGKFHPRAHKLLASYYLEKKRVDEAILHLKKLAVEADDPEAQRILGKILLAQNDAKVKTAAIDFIQRAAIPRAVANGDEKKWYVDWKAQVACGEFLSTQEKKNCFLNIMNYGRPFLGTSWIEQIYASPLYQQFVKNSNDNQITQWRNYVEYRAFQNGLHQTIDSIIPYLEKNESRTHEMNKELCSYYGNKKDNEKLLHLAVQLIKSAAVDDKQLGVHYLTMVADQQNSKAQEKLIELYLGSFGCKEYADLFKALTYLQRFGQSSFDYFFENDLASKFEALINEKDHQAQFAYGKYLIEYSWTNEQTQIEWQQKGIEFVSKSAIGLPHVYWYLADRAFLANDLKGANEYLRLASYTKEINDEAKYFAQQALSSARACAESDGETAYVLSRFYKAGIGGVLEKNEDVAANYQKIAVQLKEPDALLEELKKSSLLTVEKCLTVLQHSCSKNDSEIQKLRKRAWKQLEESKNDIEARAALVVSLLKHHDDNDLWSKEERFKKASEHFQELSALTSANYVGSELCNQAYSVLESLSATFPQEVPLLLAQFRLNLAKNVKTYDADYCENIDNIQSLIKHMRKLRIPCTDIETKMCKILVEDAESFYIKKDETNTLNFARYAVDFFPNSQEALFWSDLALIARKQTIAERKVLANVLLSIALEEKSSKKLFYTAQKLFNLGLFVESLKDFDEPSRQQVKQLLSYEMQLNPLESLLMLINGKERKCWQMNDMQLDVRQITKEHERNFATLLLNYFNIKDHAEQLILTSDIKGCIEFYPFMATHSLMIGNENEAVNYCNQFLDAFKAGCINYNEFIQNELLEQTIRCLSEIDNNPQSFDLYLTGCTQLFPRFNDLLQGIQFAEIINDDCFRETGVNRLVFKHHFNDLRNLFEQYVESHPAFHTLLGDFDRVELERVIVPGEIVLNDTKMKQRKLLESALWHYDQALNIAAPVQFSDCFSQKNIKKKISQAFEQLAITYDDGKRFCNEMKEYFDQAIKNNPETANPLFYLTQLYVKNENDDIVGEIIRVIELQARCGHVKFQELLGVAYAKGFPIQIPIGDGKKTLEFKVGANKVKGQEFLNLASKNGSYKATKLVAEQLLASKRGKDNKKGLDLLIQAFNQGGNEIAIDIASIYLQRKDYDNAFEWLSKPIQDKSHNALRHFLLAQITHTSGPKGIPDFLRHLMYICTENLPLVTRKGMTEKMREEHFILTLGPLCHNQNTNIAGLASYLITKLRYFNSLNLSEQEKNDVQGQVIKELRSLEKNDSLMVSCAAGIDLVNLNLESAFNSEKRNEDKRNEVTHTLFALSIASNKILKLDANDEIVQTMKSQIVILLECFLKYNKELKLFSDEEFNSYFKNLFSKFLEDEYSKIKTDLKNLKKINPQDNNNNNNAKK